MIGRIVNIEDLAYQLGEARVERDLLDDLIRALEPLVLGRQRRSVGKRGETERAVLAFISETQGGPWGPSNVADVIGKPRKSVSNVLSRLAKAGAIANPTHGRYEASR